MERSRPPTDVPDIESLAPVKGATAPNDVTPLESARAAGLKGDGLARHVAGELDLPYETDLSKRPASATFLQKVPVTFAREKLVLGLANNESSPAKSGRGSMTLVVADPLDGQTPDILGRYLGVWMELLVAPSEIIRDAIHAAYQSRTGIAAGAVDRLEAKPAEESIARLLAGREDLLDQHDRAPVVALVNSLLFEAVQDQASDVHLQPYEDRVVVRNRIDGVLFDAHTLPKTVQEELLSRVKVMGRMDIAEKRLPQDGRATVQVGDRVIDLRIASLPSSYGERIVIRLLDKSARRYELSDLGMDAWTLPRFQRQIRVEHGLILVTGPTGSGKSTTLYGALQELDATALNVLTLEDPIEYQLPGVSQTQINEKKGMTFARGLRNILRQDPDVIMVGEIRDQETAVMAIQSALTGHLVFSTLHTNDAASAVTRLLDLGIEPYLVASSLIGVLAQRLVRRVCTSCGSSVALAEAELLSLGIRASEIDELLDSESLIQPMGCEACRRTGYRGRAGVFELLEVSESLRQLIQTRASASALREQAESDGMVTLRSAGLQLASQGTTTLQEITRVTARANDGEILD